MEWSSFAWEGSQKEVLYVPVKLEFSEATYWLQLDTGSNRTLIYEVRLRQLLGQTKEFPSKDIILNGEIGNYRFTNVRFRVKKNYGSQGLSFEKYNEIGTLGLDFFKEKILAVDYPHERFCTCNSLAKLPEELVKKPSSQKFE